MSDLKTKALARIFSQYSEQEGFCLLESDRGRSLVFLYPTQKLEFKNSNIFLTTAEQELLVNNDLWDTLEDFVAQNSKIPQVAGFFSYEFLEQIEQIVLDASQERLVPDFIFYKYSQVLEIGIDGNITEHNFESGSSFWKESKATSDLSNLENTDFAINQFDREEFKLDLAAHSNFTLEQYCASVNQIKQLILNGEVYQVNLSQQFKYDFAYNPSQFYFALRKISPSPYATFYRLKDFYVISASPEKFIHFDKPMISVAPIKGTRARLSDLEQDDQVKLELKNSTKDLAELSMIVDLMRNDCGRVAEIGTVKVVEHARLESYAQVHHLVSEIQAHVKPEYSCIDIFRALFPSGSITGAPKIAAMKIIASLENRPRGVYTGAIGYFAKDSFCFNVAIRTAIVKNNQLYFQAGGAVVLDSDPNSEYEETIIKASSFLRAYKTVF